MRADSNGLFAIDFGDNDVREGVRSHEMIQIDDQRGHSTTATTAVREASKTHNSNDDKDLLDESTDDDDSDDETPICNRIQPKQSNDSEAVKVAASEAVKVAASEAVKVAASEAVKVAASEAVKVAASRGRIQIRSQLQIAENQSKSLSGTQLD